MDTSWDLGWWQQDRKPGQMGGKNEAIEACVSALSQTLAMCPVHHLSSEDNGEDKRLFASQAERVLLRPNEHTSGTLFFNDLVRSLYFHGNGYAFATRDGNRAVNAMYLLDPRNTNGVVDPETGDVFYWVSANRNTTYNAETDSVYAARDILNVRINSSMQEPLKGITPIAAAANSIKANSSIVGQQSSFFANMARASGVMTAPDKLTPEHANQIRDALAKQSQGENVGKVPVLGGGLKWEPMSLTSQDAQLVQAFDMTTDSIARAFRVPGAVIGQLKDNTLNNSEATMSWFLASGLGFLLENVERELAALFGLPFKQRINFDTKALLRSDWKSQMEALTQGTLGGIYSPNEARAMVGMGAVPDGEEPRVQQQVVPLSAWDKAEPVAPVAVDEEQTMSLLTKGYQSYGR
jgi:HK97 family phage portal protein